MNARAEDVCLNTILVSTALFLVGCHHKKKATDLVFLFIINRSFKTFFSLSHFQLETNRDVCDSRRVGENDEGSFLK